VCHVRPSSNHFALQDSLPHGRGGGAARQPAVVRIQREEIGSGPAELQELLIRHHCEAIAKVYLIQPGVVRGELVLGESVPALAERTIRNFQRPRAEDPSGKLNQAAVERGRRELGNRKHLRENTS